MTRKKDPTSPNSVSGGSTPINSPTTTCPLADKIKIAAIPLPGKQTETIADKPVKIDDVAGKWTGFLGAGPYSHTHPRTGEPDLTRVVSSDGNRSIRYGDHEKNSGVTKHHYHEETWITNSTTGEMDVNNVVQRVPLGGKKTDTATVEESRNNILKTFEGLTP